MVYFVLLIRGPVEGSNVQAQSTYILLASTTTGREHEDVRILYP